MEGLFFTGVFFCPQNSHFSGVRILKVRKLFVVLKNDRPKKKSKWFVKVGLF